MVTLFRAKISPEMDDSQLAAGHVNAIYDSSRSPMKSMIAYYRGLKEYGRSSESGGRFRRDAAIGKGKDAHIASND